MASQKSSALAAAPDALAPKRARGRLRVAAIMDAAALVFAEKGFEATTMSEIATRSTTAIGSLYRFFPNKEVLADALLKRYRDAILDALGALASRAAGATPTEIAGALCDMMLAREQDKAAALALIDLREGTGAIRAEMRRQTRAALAAVIEAGAPHLGAARAMIVGTVTLQMLKSFHALREEPPTTRDAAIVEMRQAVRIYLDAVLTAPGKLSSRT